MPSPCSEVSCRDRDWDFTRRRLVFGLVLLPIGYIFSCRITLQPGLWGLQEHPSSLRATGPEFRSWRHGGQGKENQQ